MKYCSNCGYELNPEDMFCTHCGQPLGVEVNTKNKASTGSNNKLKKNWLITVASLLGVVAIIFGAFIMFSDSSDKTDNGNQSDVSAGDEINTPGENNHSDSGLNLDISNNEDTNRHTGEEKGTGNPDAIDQVLGSYAASLHIVEHISDDLEGNTFVDIFKVQKNDESGYVLNISTPDITMDLTIREYEQGNMMAETVTEKMEVSYWGTIENTEEVFSTGTLHYTDFETGQKSVYQVTLYYDYKEHDDTLQAYYGTYDFYYRDYSVLEGELGPKQQEFLDTIVEGYYMYSTQFTLSPNDETSRHVLFTTNANSQVEGTYLLDDLSEISSGYLLSTFNQYIHGEQLFMRALSHPNTKVYDGMLIMNLDNGAVVAIHFEGYTNNILEEGRPDEMVENNSVTNDIDNQDIPDTQDTDFSGSWYSTGDIPFFAIIDKGKFTMPSNPGYSLPYAGQVMVNTQEGFILNNLMDLNLFKMPYTVENNILKIDVQLYGGEEFFFYENMNAYYIKDVSGNVYMSNESDGIMTKIEKLPAQVELFCQVMASFSLENNSILDLNGELVLYEEGVTDGDQPDAAYGENYEIIGSLKRNN